MAGILFDNCRIFDGAEAVPGEGMAVLVEGSRIVEISDSPISASDARVIEAGGRWLMPGLIDAHYHALLADLNVANLDIMPPSLLHQHGHVNLKATLARGYTSVRDAGGADIGLVRAVEEGLIEGPRIFHAGKALSQTGGHGDMRAQTHFEPCACAAYHGPICAVADGVDEVRKAVREELRKGAAQIKLMVSGGVLSPSDPVWMDQYSEGEIRAAVEEAATRRTYVMAHAHTVSAARRCVDFGVRSIEHGTLIDRETAEYVAASDAFVVPTLSTILMLKQHGPELGLPGIFADKLGTLFEDAQRAVAHCREAGVKLGLGSDLIGPLHIHQAMELSLRAEITSPGEALHAATRTNAALLGKQGELGTVATGAIADLLLVDGDPLQNIDLLQHQGAHLSVIMKAGTLHKCLL
ncbi:MAG: amidohydrolase family protein [Alphaproteobacteria bacterium]|jgi:imidazolonepropionase-like amidohydrolase|nr:amidohydrolase family protein [Alphaproteobacteria bacterium]MDP6588790.1 amidohydrolase family protein [Alphaproteobacteria bacterium]MDP6818260.1 amidohydrolase family protein [Alphaproteobacteria bacterium]